MLIFLGVFLGFVVLGVMIARDGDIIGWIGADFFALGIPVTIVGLLPRSSYLKLTGEGFEVCTMFKIKYHRWDDVDEILVGTISHNKMILINYSESYDKYRSDRKFSYNHTGAEDALPDTYGQKAEVLAGLMARYKIASQKQKM